MVLKQVSLSLFVIILLPLIAFAERPSGTVTVEKGIVKIRHDNKVTVLTKVGSSHIITEKDHVHTGTGAVISVLLKGKTEAITLYGDSFFSIETLNEGDSDYRMPTGQGRFHALKNRKRKRFSVRTATAIVGVQGTEFFIAATPSSTNLLTVTGIVAVANVEAPNIQVQVKKNQVTKTEKGRTPSRPVTVSPARRDQILNTADETPAGKTAFDAPPPEEKAEATKSEKKEEKADEKKDEKKKDEKKKDEKKKKDDEKKDDEKKDDEKKDDEKKDDEKKDDGKKDDEKKDDPKKDDPKKDGTAEGDGNGDGQDGDRQRERQNGDDGPPADNGESPADDGQPPADDGGPRSDDGGPPTDDRDPRAGDQPFVDEGDEPIFGGDDLGGGQSLDDPLPIAPTDLPDIPDIPEVKVEVPTRQGLSIDVKN